MAKFLDMDGVEYLINSYLKPGFTDIYNGGVKSLIPITATDRVLQGYQYTITDGYVTIDTTTPTSTTVWFQLNSDVSLKKGTYVISGGHSTLQRVIISPTINLIDAIAVSDTDGTGTEFTLTNDADNLIFAIRMQYGQTVSNLKIYPMICTKDAWKISKSWEPYAMTNYELTNNIATTTEIETMWTNS